MPVAYFGFVLFVFVLLCAFLLIARQIYKSVKKPEQFEREVNWVKRYQDLQNMVDGFEAYVDEVQEDIRQEKAEVRRIAQRVEETYRKLSGGDDIDAPVIVTLGQNRNVSGYVKQQRARRPRPGDFPSEEKPAAEEQAETAPIVEESVTEEAPPEDVVIEEEIVELPPEEPEIEPEAMEELLREFGAIPSAEEEPLAEEPMPLDRAQAVVWLHERGHGDIDIAQRLFITRNEVKLILELAEKNRE